MSSKKHLGFPGCFLFDNKVDVNMRFEKRIENMIIRAKRLKNNKEYDFSRVSTEELKELLNLLESDPENERIDIILEKGGVI